MRPTESDPHLRLLDDARVTAAAADRMQRRLLADADQQDATLRGTVEALAEAAAELVVHTTVGRRVRGSVLALSREHVTLVGDHGTGWVRLDAVTVLRIAGDRPVYAGGGERAARPMVALTDALRVLVEEQATIEVLFDGGSGLRGTAVAAGRDLLTLRDGSGEQVLVHLDRAAVVVAHT